MRILKTIAILVFVISSCKEKVELVTKDEALKMSKNIDSSINFKKPLYFNSLFDATTFTKRVAKYAGETVSNAAVKDVKETMTKMGLGDKIIRSIMDNGTYEFVNHYEKDNIHHLIFRLFSSEGLNYHDFELIKKGGKVLIADIYVYVTGETLSKTIGDLMLTLKPENQQKEFESIKKIRELVFNNEHQKAKNIYNKLSPELKSQKTVQIMNVIICAQLDESSYIEAIENYKTNFPGEANLYLILVDRYLLKKDYEKSLECVNKVDSLLGKDPFLDYYRALISNTMERPDESRKYLEQLHLNMPGFGSGVLELIANYITAGMNDKAKLLVAEYEKNEKFNQELLTNYLYTQPQFQKE